MRQPLADKRRSFIGTHGTADDRNSGAGRHASDREIFDFARRADAVLVTVNRGDFIALARRGRDHAGVIVMPSLPRDRLKPLFEAVLAAAEPLFAESANLFIEIDAAGNIASFRLP